MKLLAIGFPLPNPNIDNYNALTAPSYYDYDAVVVDPASLTRVAAQVAEGGDPLQAYDGRPIVNGASSAAAVSAAEQFQRRLDETSRLLEQGGAVIVLGRPNAIQHGVVGFEGCDRYSWLPAPEGISWAAPLLRAAEGANLRIVDDHHPCSSLIRDFRRRMGYRAVFDQRLPALQRAAHVFAEARPGLAVGAEFSVLGGRIAFLPALVDDSGQSRADFAEALLAVATDLLQSRVSGPPPTWIADFTLPGLQEADEALREARRQMERAREEIEQQQARRDEVGLYLDLLWAEGPAFREAVRRALLLLGFEEESPQGAPLSVKADDTEVCVEIESSRDEVAEWPYIRLQRRLEERLLKRGEQPRGMVVVTGKRLTAPAQRGTTFTAPLRIACENYRYCLVTGDTLFELVKRALEDADDTSLDGFRRRIVRHFGLLSSPVALGEAEPEDGNPLF